MSSTPGLQPGTVLRGKYRIARMIGQGGMGSVFEAMHLDLDRRVAVKVLNPELRSRPDLVERFLREGKAASKLESEHVARVLDVDRLDDGTPFLVIEYLVGCDLSALLHSRGPMPIRDAVAYVLQACLALQEAHARGIIHRDLKPSNLFLTRLHDGSSKVKVLDFGISKIVDQIDPTAPRMTKTAVSMGTAEYMSPEQMRSARDVDARTDVWALGAVLFEFLTGVIPFAGETITEIRAQVMTQTPASPRVLRPEVTEALASIVLRCLERDRDNRVASVGELASELRGVLAALPRDASAAPEERFEVTIDGDPIVGPVSLDLVRRGFAVGKIDASAKVRRVGENKWKPVLDLLSAEHPVRRAHTDADEGATVLLSRWAIEEALDAVSTAPRHEPSTHAAVSTVVSVEPQKRALTQTRWPIAVAAAGLLAAAVALLTLRPWDRALTREPSETVVSALLAPPAPTIAVSTVGGPTVEIGSAVLAAASATPATSAPAPSASVAAPVVTPTQRPAATTAPIKPLANCSPPYTTGPDGHRHMRPECY